MFQVFSRRFKCILFGIWHKIDYNKCCNLPILQNQISFRSVPGHPKSQDKNWANDNPRCAECRVYLPRFGFCVYTWLYLWAWFVPVYLWFDKHVHETLACTFECHWYPWSSTCTCVHVIWQACTWDLDAPVGCQWYMVYSWSLICTCVVWLDKYVLQTCMYLWVVNITHEA